MGNIRSYKRNLQIDKVHYAEETHMARKQFEQQVVKERVEKDAEFAKDVIQAVGDNLPADIKKSAEECIAKSVVTENG